MSEVETHPWLHDWEVSGDYVHTENRKGKPTAVRREERCTACSKIRLTVIDLPSWTVRYRRYLGKVTVHRLPKSEYLKQAFARTTTFSRSQMARIL